MTKTVIGYIRVSTGKQADHGISLEAQHARIEAYCTLHDLELLEVLQDASSAKSIDGRPAMKQLLKLARSNAVDAVVTCKLDRMFRNTVEAITIIPELQALGVSTHIMDLGGVSLDTSTPMGGFFLTVAAAFAEMERKQIGERTRTALRHKRDAGKQYSAVAPYGWSYEDGNLIEDGYAQGVLKHIIHDEVLAGQGPTTIANRLTESVHMTRNGKKVWQPGTIAKIIKHPLVLEKFDQWERQYRDNEKAHAEHSGALHGDSSTGNSDEESHVPVH